METNTDWQALKKGGRDSFTCHRPPRKSFLAAASPRCRFFPLLIQLTSLSWPAHNRERSMSSARRVSPSVAAARQLQPRSPRTPVPAPVYQSNTKHKHSYGILLRCVGFVCGGGGLRYAHAVLWIHGGTALLFFRAPDSVSRNVSISKLERKG